MKMKGRHYVVFIVLLGVVAGVLTLQADVLSISLNGYSLAYHDVARHFLGKPPLFVANRAMNRVNAFCGNQMLEEELQKLPEDMVCIADFLNTRPVKDCDPVATREIIPTYIFPYFDRLITNIAVTVDNASDLAGYIENSSEQALLDMGVARGGSGDFLPRGKKDILFHQCLGYGTISVIQSYYGHSQFGPGCFGPC